MTNDIGTLVDGIEFDVDKSMRYHQRRRDFYECLHRSVMFLILVFGSAAFASLFDAPNLFGAATAVLGALDLVFNLSHRARDHEILYRRFSELAAEIVRTSTRTMEQVALWEDKKIKIEADEPPVYWALEASCDNEATIARGWEKQNGLVPISFHKKLLMNWLTFAKDQMPRTTPTGTATASGR